MADRSVTVYLKAQVADFNRQMESAATSAKKLGQKASESSTEATTALGRMTKSALDNKDAWDKAGTTLTAFGAGTVAALGYSAKAAIDWQSAWAGVTKTVDGTPEELAAIEQGLRELAQTLPASHQEIAAVAEAAGQLGVATPNVLSFTRTMIDLGETTNLSADEAATAIARFTNVMKTSQSDVGRLGSTVVALGNNFATTEAEIVEMGQRLSAAGAIAGFTEPQVLGLATAMSSIGIEAEAGGSAMSQVIQSISKAVASGGKDVQTFADLAGMSAADFTAAWKSDPITALDAVVSGLARMNDGGENSYQTLEDLGLSGIRQTAVLQGLATATGLTTEAVGLATQAWADNTALVEEAEKRYDTAEAKLQIAKNSINDAAISFGEVFLPAVSGAAEAVADFAQWMGNLPDPIKQAVGGLGGIVGVLALVAGGFLLTFPRVVETVKAFQTLKTASPGVTSALGKVGRAAGIVGSAMAVMAASSAIPEWGVNVAEGTGAATRALLDVASGAQTADEAFSGMFASGSFKDWFTGNEIDSIETAFGVLKDPSVSQNVDNVISSVLTLGQTTSTNRLQAQELFDTIDQGLASLVQSGAADQAAAALDSMGISLEGNTDILPAYADAVAAVDAEQQLTGESATTAADGISGVGDAADEAAEALEQWRESAAEAFASFIDGQDAYDSAIEATQEWAEAQAESTSSSSDSWEDFYDGVSVSAEAYIAQLQEQVAAQENWQANLTDLSARTADALTGDMETAAQAMIDELIDLGPAGAEQVALLASMTDAELTQVVELWSRKGSESAAGFTGAIEGVRNPQITVRADTDLAVEDLAGVLSVIDTASGTVTIEGEDGPVEETLTGATARIDEAAGTVTIYGDDGQAVTTLTGYTTQVDRSGGTVTISGNDAQGRTTTTTLTNWINAQGASVAVTANTWAAEAAMRTFVSSWNGATVTVNAAANTYSASGGMPGGATAVSRAAGGPVFGPGTETSDSIMAWLSNQEHVWSAAEVRGAGGHGAVAAMRAAARAHTLPGFADGGSPGYAVGVPATSSSGTTVVMPDTVRLDSASVTAVAQAILAGARDVSALTLAQADRATRGSMQTRGATW